MNSPIQEQTVIGEQSNLMSPKQGLKVLIAELTLQKRHLKVVREQNAALIACDKLRFQALHEEYVVLMGELEIQSKLRIANFGTKKVEATLKDWPELDRRNAEKVIAELKVIVTEVQRLNGQNRKLLGNQVKYIDFMLNLLINTYRKGSMYGPQGAKSINRGNLFINSAA